MSNFSIVKNWCLPSIQSFLNTLPSGRIKVLSRCQHRLGGFCSASRTLINLPPSGAYLDQTFISREPPVPWLWLWLWLCGPMVHHCTGSSGGNITHTSNCILHFLQLIIKFPVRKKSKKVKDIINVRFFTFENLKDCKLLNEIVSKEIIFLTHQNFQ